MATVREEKLHVVHETDRHRVVLHVPGDLPFTANSILETLGALQQYSHGVPYFTWSRMFGLRFILSLNDEAAATFDLEALAESELPLRVNRPAKDEQPLRALFIDTMSRTSESVAVLRPEQVLTTHQLNALVDGWVHEDDTLRRGPWFMRLENNCLVLGFMYAPRMIFMRVVNPIYGATVEPTVHIYSDDHGRLDQATVTLQCKLTRRGFLVKLWAGAELPGFSDLSERRRVIRATYTGPEVHQAKPELLVADLRKTVLTLMRTLGVHQPLYGAFTVVLHEPNCAPGESHENDLVLTREFPIDSL